MNTCLNNRLIRGFALIEFLVVISIIGIITAVGVSSYGAFNRKQRVFQTGLSLKNDLRFAQSLAMSSSVSCGGAFPVLYGFRVRVQDASTYTTAYICSDDDGVMTSPVILDTVVLSDELSISPVPSSILFLSPVGTPESAADTAFVIQSTNTTAASTVTVRASGDIDVSQTIGP